MASGLNTQRGIGSEGLIERLPLCVKEFWASVGGHPGLKGISEALLRTGTEAAVHTCKV